MKDSGEIFIREFVIGLGFLSGLWISIGINPESEIIKAFAQVLKELGSNLGFLFYIIPIIVFIGSIFVAYQQGGKLGLFAIGAGFLGGLLIVPASILGVIFVIVGFVLGLIAID